MALKKEGKLNTASSDDLTVRTTELPDFVDEVVCCTKSKNQKWLSSHVDFWENSWVVSAEANNNVSLVEEVLSC